MTSFIFLAILFILGASTIGAIYMANWARKARIEAGRELHGLLVELTTEPLNRHRQATILVLLNGKLSDMFGYLASAGVSSASVYQRALALFEAHPTDEDLRTFVSNVGRWHYSRSRSDGMVTGDDERAIQKDLLAYLAPVLGS